MRTLSLVVLVACASVPPQPPGGPRGLRASEHLDEAHRHDEASRQTWPTTTATAPGDPNAPAILPWYRTWNTTADHERHARIHRSEAAALHAAYEEACGTRELKRVVGSPLTRHRTGGWNTSTGVVVYLSPLAGTAETLLADLSCHRAWMMLAPAGGMDDCPLDLPGLQIDARGDDSGITLLVSVRDPKLIFELQRRMAKQIEETSKQVHEE